MHQPKDIIVLLRKYLSGTLNDQENAALQEWAKAKPENQRLLEHIAQEKLLRSDIQLYWDLWNETEAPGREQRIIDSVLQKTASQRRPLSHRLRRWIPYAAAALLILGIVILSINRQPEQVSESNLTAQDILPGGKRATLTLADGRTIDLKSDQTGIVVGDDIAYLDGSTITGNISSEPGRTSASETLALKTPIGGNYHIVLPDGTQAWLNASSTLIYPSRFAAEERIVHLEGEAYFEVQQQHHDGKAVPFKVMSDGQTINVLGTEFNILAYAGEPQTKTTLVSGSIEVINLASNSTTSITPGQQSTLQGAQTLVQEVDVSKAIAWTNGRFSFDGKAFEQIMGEMARWYNLTVEYEDGIPTDRFLGDAYKTDKLSTVLRFLESSDIQYRVEPGQHGTHRLVIHQSGRKEDHD